MGRPSTGCGCPMCHSQDTRVHNSRAKLWKGITTVHWGRECLKCKHRWYTYEVPTNMMADSVENMEAMRTEIKKQLITELVRQL